MSTATSASVGPSPSSGAKTAAVAAKGRWMPSATSCVAAPQRAGVDPDRRRHVPRGDAESAVACSCGGVHVVSLGSLIARGRRRSRAGWAVPRARIGPRARRRRPRPRRAMAIVPATANASRVPPCSVRTPARRPPERRAAHEREEVEARRSAAQVLGGGELERRERARAPEDVEDPRHEEDGADGREGVLRSEQRAGSHRSRAAPTSTSSSRAFPIVARIRAPQSAPAPKTEAIRPNVAAPWSSVSRASERQQHVEVERERADEEDREERDRDAARAPDEGECLADAGEHRRRRRRHGEAVARGASRGWRRSRPA